MGLMWTPKKYLDANSRIDLKYHPNEIPNFYWHAIWDKKNDGTYSPLRFNDANQTDYDDKLLIQAGYVKNQLSADLNEMNFGNITLNAGTYKLSFVYIKTTDSGIIEILHGSTSLGTWDAYAVASAFNQVGTATYSPTTRVTGNLRLRVNGKNASSSDYYVYFSRIELIRTG